MNPIARVVDRTLDAVRRRLDERALHRFNDAPLCSGPLGSAADYQRLWAEARARSYPAIDAYEQECAAAIDPSWFQELALPTQVTIKRSELCYQHGRLLYSTLSRYLRTRVRDNLTIVETGTARGFSALCMAKALADGGASGKIVSFDVLPHDVRILWNCIRDVDGPRTRAELLQDHAELIERYLVFHQGDTRQEMARTSLARVHFAFLDSVHTYDHVMAEFNAIDGRQRGGDVLFFDDYSAAAFPGVVKAADEICRTRGYSGTVVNASADRRYLIAEKR